MLQLQFKFVRRHCLKGFTRDNHQGRATLQFSLFNSTVVANHDVEGSWQTGRGLQYRLIGFLELLLVADNSRIIPGYYPRSQNDHH
jgi:hypothetical protein